MSKQKQSNVATQTRKPINKNALIISIVCVVTALVIAVSLIIALWPAPADKTIADLDNPTIETSDSTIKNGDFSYVGEEATLYPKSAQDWSKYTWQEPTNEYTQYYKEILSNTNTLMGIVDTNDWDKVSNDLSKYGITIDNPGIPVQDAKDSNVYMIHNREQYSASIYSRSFSVAASTSVKISVYLKTVNVDGAGAFVMVKQNSNNAVETSSSNTQYWYMHKGIKDAGVTGTTEWQKYDFYFFNQTSSSKTLYINVGLGNIYDNTTATGTLFIDEITYETVTANDYRLHKDDGNSAYTAEKESEDNPSTVATLSGSDPSNVTADVVTAGQYLTEYTYSPFLNDADNLIKVSNNGTYSGQVAVKSSDITVDGPSTNTHLHISLWVRVISENNSVLPNANIYLYEQGNTTELSSFTAVRTSGEIETDDNNGWLQYHFYVRPAQGNKTLYLLISLGDKNGYVNTDAIPNGTMYVSYPVVEEITRDEYSSATSGTYVNTVDLGNTYTSSDAFFDTFDSYTNNSSTTGLLTPSGWTPVYAGAVELTKNGKDDITVNDSYNSVTSGIERDSAVAPTNDKEEKAVLKITNNVSTAFGYMSSDISLSANTVYLISVLGRSDGTAKPSVYLMDYDEDNNVSMSYALSTINNKVDDDKFNNLEQTGWTRYYFVVATGDTAKTVRLVLFNGAMDATGSDTSKQSSGTVYFDQAWAKSIGTYKRDNTAEQLYTKDDNGEWILDEELAKEMTYTATAGYDELDTLIADLQNEDGTYKFDNIQIVDNRLTDIATPTEEEDGGTDGDTTTPTNNVDAGLIVSIVISSLLLAAVVIVVLVKFVFRRRG